MVLCFWKKIRLFPVPVVGILAPQLHVVVVVALAWGQE